MEDIWKDLEEKEGEMDRKKEEKIRKPLGHKGWQISTKIVLAIWSQIGYNVVTNREQMETRSDLILC